MTAPDDLQARLRKRNGTIGGYPSLLTEAGDRIDALEANVGSFSFQHTLDQGQIAADARRIAELEAALNQLAYQDSYSKRWRTALHGDSDVTEIVGALLAPAKEPIA